MAFKVRNLSVLAYANGFTLWHYKTNEDTLDFLFSDQYFVQSCDMLSVGDMIMMTGLDGSSFRSVSVVSTEAVITSAMV